MSSDNPSSPEVNQAAVSYEERFRFLFPSGPVGHRPRLVMYPPDLHDLCWCIWDRVEVRTVCRGQTPEQAIDTALSISLVNQTLIPPVAD